MPICTVVIPAYNCRWYIRDAVTSVLDQTLQDIEICVVDDCSSDGTDDIIKDLAQSDKRIKYYRNSKNLKVAETRNRGVAESTGEWIAFLDSDDVWSADKLEKQLLLAESTHADMVYTGAYLMDDLGVPTGRIIRVPARTNYASLLCGNDIICSSVLIKRELLLAHPMQHSDLHEDYICWLKLLKGGIVACGTNEPLIGYRLAVGSKSRNKRKSALMTWKSYGVVGIKGIQRICYFAAYTLHGLKRYI